MALTRPRQSQLRDSDYKNSCRVVTVSNITLSGGTPATVDGVSLQVANRILVTAQTDASENGIYLVNTVGSGSDGTWQRSLDFNSNAVVTSGALVPITEGTSYANTLWRLTTADPITIDTTNLTFVNNILTDVVQDTTPQLGGDLDLNSNNITGTGNINTTGTITATGNLTVDTNTLFVNASNNRVGIGTASPAYQVEIENTSANALLVLDRTDGASTFIEGGASDSVLGSVGANDVKIAYNSVPVVTIGSGGAITTSGNITGGTLRADNFTTENAFAIVGNDNNLIQDTTLSVDPASNYLGINQTSPEVTLHMTGEGAQTAQIRMEQYNDSADAPDVRTRRYRGTIASPSAVQSGDYLFRSNHEYYNGTSLLVGGAFAFDNTNNAARTQFSVAVDTDGTGANPQGNNGQFKIDGNDGGAITFNNAYKFPTTDGSANQVLQTNGSGILTFADRLSDVVDDTTPQLGGNLDGQAFNITTTGTGTFGTMTDGTVSFTSGNISGVDELRIDQSGTGLRMTNVGAFDNDGSDNFRIFATNDLKIAANGENGTAITVDATNQDVTITNDLIVSGNLTASGNINTDPTATSVGTSATSVDTFSASTYRGAKYMVTVANSTNFDIIEALVVHNGTTATITVYGEVSTNTSLGDLTTDISSGNVRLLYTGGATGNSVKVFATYIT